MAAGAPGWRAVKGSLSSALAGLVAGRAVVFQRVRDLGSCVSQAGPAVRCCGHTVVTQTCSATRKSGEPLKKWWSRDTSPEKEETGCFFEVSYAIFKSTGCLWILEVAVFQWLKQTPSLVGTFQKEEGVRRWERWGTIVGSLVMLGTAVLSPAFRLKLAFQPGPGYQHGGWYGRHVLPAYSCGCARARDGTNLLRACAIPEYAAGALGMAKMPLVRVTRVPKEEITGLAKNQDEDPLEDPNLHLNVEALNKEFMAKSEELYDLLMNCHWQPLDSVESNIPDNSLE